MKRTELLCGELMLLSYQFALDVVTCGFCWLLVALGETGPPQYSVGQSVDLHAAAKQNEEKKASCSV